MSGTEATPLMRGRAQISSLRAPSEKEEEEGGGDVGRDQLLLQPPQAHRPRSWHSNRLLLALLGFGMAIAAGFISATQTIERFRQPSQQRQQQQGGAGTEGGGAASSVGDLARTVHGSGEPLPRLDVSSGADGRAGNARQEPQDSTSTRPADSTASTITVNGPGPAWSGHGLGSEGQTAEADSELSLIHI